MLDRGRSRHGRPRHRAPSDSDSGDERSSSSSPPPNKSSRRQMSRVEQGLGRSKSDALKLPASPRPPRNEGNGESASQSLGLNRGRGLGRSRSDVPKRSSVSSPSENNAASSKNNTRKDLARSKSDDPNSLSVYRRPSNKSHQHQHPGHEDQDSESSNANDKRISSSSHPIRSQLARVSSTDNTPDSPSLGPSRSQLSIRPGPEEQQVSIQDDEKASRPSKNQASRRRPKPPPDEPSHNSPKKTFTNVVKKYSTKATMVAIATTIGFLDVAYHEIRARRETRKHEERMHRRERKDKRETTEHIQAMNSYRERTSHADLLLKINELPEEHRGYISPHPHRGYRWGDDERGRGSYEKEVYERRVSRSRS